MCRFFCESTFKGLLLNLCFKGCCIYAFQHICTGHRIFCVNIHRLLYFIPANLFESDGCRITCSCLYSCNFSISLKLCRIASAFDSKCSAIEHNEISDIHCCLTIQFDICIHIGRIIKQLIIHCDRICCFIHICPYWDRQHIRLKNNIFRLCIFITISVSISCSNLYICKLTVLFLRRIQCTFVRS